MRATRLVGWVSNVAADSFAGYGVPFGGGCDGPTLSIANIDGDPVAAACDHGAGRVYVWGDDWVEYPETWDAGLDTQQFWQDAIDWLAHRD